MSLTTNGVWAANVWESTVWASCVWHEPGCVVTPPAPSYRGGGASGRSYSWAPDELPKGDFVLKYEKTKHDEELERLLREAIKREDLAKKAAHIADIAAQRVTGVQDISRAAEHIGREVLKLQQSHIITQREAQKRTERLKKEEDLILSILLSEML